MKQYSANNQNQGSDLIFAAETIGRGGVIAIPTETYYGLAVDPQNEEALTRLFHIKQRPRQKPILLLIADPVQLADLVEFIPEPYEPLMARHWPGALTLVFQARKNVSKILTGGTGTVGIRFTPHPMAKKIIQILGRPVTATSANISGHIPATNTAAVYSQFPDVLDYVVDGGEAKPGPASTVVKYRDGALCIARKGRVQLGADVPLCR